MPTQLHLHKMIVELNDPIDYFFKTEKSSAILLNRRLRDASAYQGIKFYAKATIPTTIVTLLFDQNFEDTNNNKWLNPRTVYSTWKEYKIPFSEFIIAGGYENVAPGGDGALDLDNIEKIGLAIPGKINARNEKATIWIDEITLY